MRGVAATRRWGWSGREQPDTPLTIARATVGRRGGTRRRTDRPPSRLRYRRVSRTPSARRVGARPGRPPRRHRADRAAASTLRCPSTLANRRSASVGSAPEIGSFPVLPRDRRGDGGRTCLFAIVVMLALSGVACGGSGGGCTADKATALSGPLTMHGRAFSPDCFKVGSGSTISVDNKDTIPHTFTIRGSNVDLHLVGGQAGRDRKSVV